MCGIGGYYCFGDKRPEKSELASLLVYMSDRGTDATGIAYFDEDIVIRKQPLPSPEFVRGKMWKSASTPRMMIMHTRQGTTGSEKDNNNNHPIYSKESGLVMVHNGIVHNDRMIRADLEKDNPKLFDGEVDSECLVRLAEQKGKWRESIKHMAENASGSYACAFFHRDRPEQLCLLRHNNPLYWGIDKKRDILFFASTGEIMRSGLGSSYRGFYEPNQMKAHEMPDDTCIVINPEGLADEFGFETKGWVGSGAGFGYGGYHIDGNYSGSSHNKTTKTKKSTEKIVDADPFDVKDEIDLLSDTQDVSREAQEVIDQINNKLEAWWFPNAGKVQCPICFTVMDESVVMVGESNKCWHCKADMLKFDVVDPDSFVGP